MLCQNCQRNEATTHVKRIVNGDMTETHLCAECVKLLGMDDVFSDFSFGLKDIFGSFFGDMLPAIGQSAVLRCSKCGCTFDDVVKTGKLGCAQCYDTFYDKLLPSLQRIHGKLHHVGKIGTAQKESAGAQAAQAEEVQSAPKTVDMKIAELRELMNAAVEQQNFEEAARLRDEIKVLEGSDNQ